MSRKTAITTIAILLLIIAALSGVLLGRSMSPVAQNSLPALNATPAEPISNLQNIEKEQRDLAEKPASEPLDSEGQYLYRSGAFQYSLHKCNGDTNNNFCARVKNERNGKNANFISSDDNDVIAYSYFSPSDANIGPEDEGFIASDCVGPPSETAAISLKAMGLKDFKNLSCDGDEEYSAMEDSRFFYYGKTATPNTPLQ